jgi:hypothetical protein
VVLADSVPVVRRRPQPRSFVFQDGHMYRR